jgi:hypothetical protein
MMAITALIAVTKIIKEEVLGQCIAAIFFQAKTCPGDEGEIAAGG